MKTLIFKLIQNKHSRRVLMAACTWIAHSSMHMIPHVGSHLISHVVISFVGALLGGGHE